MSVPQRRTAASPPRPRIALIHALAHSIAPVAAELDRAWPACVRMNLLDDSLSADLAASPTGLDAATTARFIALSDYAIGTGARGILFTCSAFGPCIDAVARRWPAIPVLKPNEAMIVDAAARGRRIGLIASFAPTLASMPAEFPARVTVLPMLADGALAALDRGDRELHDQLVAAAAERAVAQGCDVVALAQFSLARAAPAVERAVPVPVLTTVGSAVRELRRRVEGTIVQSPSTGPA